MSNSSEIRWRQRLEHLERAMRDLEDACQLTSYSKLERAGLVQIFELAFELAWKTLKDLLFYEGYDETTPRDVLRTAFPAGYLSEAAAETALDALGKRHLLSHTYDEKLAEMAVGLIRERYTPMLLELLATLRHGRDHV